MAGRSQLPVQIMENQTRFDLNAAIESWRSELAAQPNLASDDRRELETHLRDAVAGFQQRGLNDEESFWLARRRVGQPLELCEEFVKTDPAKVWRERVFWMVVAMFLIQLFSQTVSFFWFSTRYNLLGYLEHLWPQAKGKKDFLSDLSFVESFSRYLPLLSFVLVMGFIMSLPKERLNYCICKFQFFFKSRFRFLLTFVFFFSAYFLMLLNFALRTDVFYEGSYAVYTSPPIRIVSILGIEYAIFPILLAVLIIWLMPTQNRKTPKRT